MAFAAFGVNDQEIGTHYFHKKYDNFAKIPCDDLMEN